MFTVVIGFNKVVAARTLASFAVLSVLLCTGCALNRPFAVAEVAPGIWVGSQPKTRADFAELRQHGVRTILSLRTSPWTILPESKRARQEGMAYRHIPLPAWPLPPSERTVKKVLLTLRNPSLQPIFMHCFLGRDRGAMNIALYRVYYQGVAPEDAWEEALRRGLKLRWVLRGLRVYFWHHVNKPDWVERSRPPPSTNNPAIGSSSGER